MVSIERLHLQNEIFKAATFPWININMHLEETAQNAFRLPKYWSYRSFRTQVDLYPVDLYPVFGSFLPRIQLIRILLGVLRVQNL